MDSEDIVICTLNNKWPFSYSLGMSSRSKYNLAWPLNQALQLCKKKIQNTLHKRRYTL